MTKKQLKIKLNDIIDRKQIAYARYSQSKHKDQTWKEIMSRTDAELVAFKAILYSLNGNDVMINTY